MAVMAWPANSERLMTMASIPEKLATIELRRNPLSPKKAREVLVMVLMMIVMEVLIAMIVIVRAMMFV